LLSVDLHNAEYYFQANPSAKSEQIAHYFADISSHYEQKGFKKMIVFLDRNTTHKTKMQSIFAELSKDRSIKTEFHLMAAYSPQLNLVEYAIHIIRQKILHQADCKTNLKEFEKQIKTLCDEKKILDKQGIINILVHIESLVPIF
jgi:hypothetical protein